jgi:hypothetical protein
LKDNSIDLICAHPPYANIIHYTNSKESDLSFLELDDFLKEMTKVAKESFRVLKPGKQCAILIGDTRRKKHIIPLGFKLINIYLNEGFKLKELVIKRQHNCKTTGFWYANSIKNNFLLLAHEYLPIFEKPKTSTPLIIKEKEIDYSSIVHVFWKRLLKNKIEKFETTTVWIFPENNFEKFLNQNVINRYSKGKDCSVINFVSQLKGNLKVTFWGNQKPKDLLYIKSPFLNESPSRMDIEYYLKRIKNIVIKELPNISNGGFFVIQTKDIRIDGYIEPLAKKIVDELIHDNLWLKEIIVVTQEGTNSNPLNSDEYLKIVHQYLLVYEVRK